MLRIIPSILILLSTHILCLAQEPASLATVLDSFHKEQANPKDLKTINSIRLSGTLLTPQGEEAQLTLVKKRPNKVRLTLKFPDKTITQAYNGQFTWLQIGATPYTILPYEENLIFTISAPLFHHLLEPAESNAHVTYQGKAFVKTTPVYHVKALLDSGHEIDYFLNDQNFQEEKITFTLKDQYPSHSTLFSDFRPVGPIKQAFHLQNYIGNELDSVIKIDHIHFNVGALDSYFDPINHTPRTAILPK